MTRIERENEVFTKLEKYTKELTEEQYNYEVLIGSMTNEDYDVVIEYLEKQIALVNQHPDSKKRFEIMKSFFQKLESDHFYNLYKEKTSKNGFYDAKKVTQGARTLYDNTEKLRNSVNREEEIDSLCKRYAHSYERACRLYFKPLVYAITKKNIESCGDCISKLLQYYPDLEFVLEPFVPQIRNSIDHVDFYDKPKDDMITFEDRGKTPLNLPIASLRAICTLQTASDVCISAALRAMELSEFKVVQNYYKKTEEYCRILQIDFKTIILTWVSKGRSILSLYNALEKIIHEK